MTNSEERHYQMLFEHAPIALWEQDFSGIKRLFDELKSQGITSLEGHLQKHAEFVGQCMKEIRSVKLNLQTVKMFKAKNEQDLLANLDKAFRDGMQHHFQSELLALWNGELTWSGEGVNYALDGTPIDILLNWRILPGSELSWEQVLVTIEDITARKQAERRFHNLFELAPISLWEEDYSAVKKYFDELRAQGVQYIDQYFDLHPEAVTHCMSLIKVINVNHKTLELFGATSKEELLSNLSTVFRDEMGVHFRRELTDMWNGKLAYDREGVNYSLNGEPVEIHIDFKIMPGHEDDFGWALVAIQDITARKKAEDYLRYLGTHDVMTGVYNRAYFDETLTRLERERNDPLSIIIADLNGLKIANDTLGHMAGDNLIRRASEVLKANEDENHITARIGGDEFVIFLPGADEEKVRVEIEQIQALVALNNKYYGDPELSISLGAATSRAGIQLEKVIIAADNAMYDMKRKRRRGDQPA